MRFTLQGYIEQLVAFLKDNYTQLGSDVTIKTKTVFIGKVKFFVLESKIYHKEKKYAYWTEMYITELGQKEFGITAIYDNEKDKQIITESILNSKFTTK